MSGLKCSAVVYFSALARLTPHGVSGLKCDLVDCPDCVYASHPAWGEWIEMARGGHYAPACGWSSHPAWGEWIEIPLHQFDVNPSGASHPAWGEWIEIFRLHAASAPMYGSHPAWGEWIEILSDTFLLR